MEQLHDLIFAHRQASIDWHKAWVVAYGISDSGFTPLRIPTAEQNDALNKAILLTEEIENELDALIR